MKKLLLAVPLSLLILFLGFNLAQAVDEPWCSGLTPGERSGGLVPCGRSCDDPTTPEDETASCQLCHFFVMIEKWIDGLLFRIVPALAALMIAIGGGMYVLSRGDPEKLSQAKKIFASIAIGMVIIYSAWLIINLFFMIIGFSEFGLSLTGPDKWFKIDCP